MTERIFGFFTCHSDGTLWIKRNPRVEDSAYRTAVPNVWTWQAQDIDDDDNSGVEYELNTYLTVKETTGSFAHYTAGEMALVTGRTNLFSPAQATGSQTLPDHIALNEDDGLARIGHVHQYANRPVLDIVIKPGASLVGEFVSPADVEWHTMDFAEFDIGDVGVFDMRHLATKVIRQWTIDRKRGVTLRHLLTFEPETTGLPAQKIEYDAPTGETIPPEIPAECEELLVNNKSGAWVDMVFPTSSAKTYTVIASGGPYAFAGGGRLRDFAYNDTQATPTLIGGWANQTRGGLSLSAPSYSATHIYTWTGLAGTDQAWGFRIFDSAYSDNEDANYTVSICEE